MLVGILQTASRLQDAVQRLAERQRPLVLHQHREVGAFHVLHHQEMGAAGFVGVVSRDDVGVFELGGRFNLALETPQRLGRQHDLGRQDFQSDQPFHPSMLGLEHQSHTALAELVEDQIVAQHQRLASARVDLLGLVGGELLLPDQLASQLLPVFRAAILGQRGDERINFGGRQQAAVGDVRNEFVQRDCHKRTPWAPILAIQPAYGTIHSANFPTWTFYPHVKHQPCCIGSLPE